MFPRPRLVASAVVLAGMVAVLLLGVVSPGASVTKSGRVSVRLTKTSFTVAQARSAKLVCTFSPTSRRWSYVLSFKTGAKWVTVRSVNRTGSFKGSHSMTVKKLFGSKPVKVGSYRIKVSADANSVTRTFKVIKNAGSSTGSKPEAGHWVSTSLSGPRGRVTSVSFDVSAGQTSVAGFSFEYEYSNGPCSGSARAWIDTASPIAGGEFETPGSSSWSSTAAGVAPASGTFRGTFDSATKAHGTAQMLLMVSCSGMPMMPSSSGVFSWTATRSSG